MGNLPTIDRRTFLHHAALAAAVLAFPGAGARAEAVADGLSEKTLLNLRRLAMLYTGVQLDGDVTFGVTPFDTYFNYRAARIARYRQRLESWCIELEKTALECHGLSFWDCSAAECHAVVAELFPTAPGARAGTDEAPVFNVSWVTDVQRPIIRVYAATYAWTDFGYPAWPGQPRGLENYRLPNGGGR